ncbi:farnesyltransferase [Thecamonas trahens ATCC 50062]|uniref:Protein farnesyltransferase subunit beta n=1 Tax=Thecamonas trahens ATCC 50062 TaxID=461836 RepID=A0A0L0D7W4_THETB|nr:farnesyltransferase [Thecamonas trahens ATCC 50062]KNC48295.1 farnesyltransferase [Thecamonas trahens ATCC 50062]|eukprot:XP_013758862.1 farnesyltransferase [Thecamonas trahens ATCC 50062]
MVLNKGGHEGFVRRGLGRLGAGYQTLDASRPWIVYWCLNALDLMGAPLGEDLEAGVISFLSHCQDPNGGFAGGPGQLAHLAPTYAAVCALSIVGSPEAYEVIDRPALRSWLLSLKAECGAFCMHHDGEVDTRASYCAVHVASVTGILDDELRRGVGEFVASCQGFDGGIGALPGSEPHGGYTYCGLAAMLLVGSTHLLRMEPLLFWVASRQMRVEGGFQGRTNKLVDGCYSFWQGAVPPMAAWALSHGADSVYEVGTMYAPPQSIAPGEVVEARFVRGGSHLFSQEALQDYILVAAQQPRGGLRDKPERYADYYHTCYNLAGLSVAQHNSDGSLTIVGSPFNLLQPVDPVYAISQNKAIQAVRYFADLGPVM